jgi:lysine 6-dehydrogenase
VSSVESGQEKKMRTVVLGAGIVGSAAIWDLIRRGHEVSVADANPEIALAASERFSIPSMALDVDDHDGLTDLLAANDAVVSAVPYRYGANVAAAAIEARTHYTDFGGNPSVVAAQKRLDEEARRNGVMVVPDCGLAPGLANVMATQMITDAAGEDIASVQIRVGALPQQPSGALGYQLAFNPAGLINEYAEPCEVLEGGTYRTVEPLTRFETVEWERWGPLEAFSTAGGTSTMCAVHAEAVGDLEYKTLRFPGHGEVFRALLEIGMFDEAPGQFGVSPRDILLASLDQSLPRGEPDLVLVRVTLIAGGSESIWQFEDVEQNGFTALARTTAFPATALIDLIGRGAVNRPGVLTMNEAVTGNELLPELEPVNIIVERL